MVVKKEKKNTNSNAQIATFACIISWTHILYNGCLEMCYGLCMCVMEHVVQDQLQFTLQLCDSLGSSGWLNNATGLDSSRLQMCMFKSLLRTEHRSIYNFFYKLTFNFTTLSPKRDLCTDMSLRTCLFFYDKKRGFTFFLFGQHFLCHIILVPMHPRGIGL